MTVPEISSQPSEPSNRKHTVRIMAWILTILLSMIPDIVIYHITGDTPLWPYFAKIVLVILFIDITFLWKDIVVLRNYSLALGTLWLSHIVYALVIGSKWYRDLLTVSTHLSARVLVEDIPKYIMAAIMVQALFMLLRNWSKFFFAKGDTSVETEPVPLLIVRSGMSVRAFGIAYTLLSILIGFIWNLISHRPSLSMLSSALPLIPFGLLSLLFSALTEEVLFRSSFISVSHEVVGKGQSLWMAALVFGSVHYIGGQPTMLLSFLNATIIGWGLGKVMLESKSILFPWALHFAINSAFFITKALGTTLQ